MVSILHTKIPWIAIFIAEAIARKGDAKNGRSLIIEGRGRSSVAFLKGSKKKIRRGFPSSTQQHIHAQWLASKEP
jgi:hypothetical protein